jgi:tetratricopeptide (TPR) repeat protein
MKLVRFLPGALVLVPTLLFAQAQGRIKGVVTDAGTGKRIAGAKVILTCPEISNFRRELVTDDKGGFATLIVDATKQYLFHVEAQGYQPVEQMNKPLIGGQTLELSFALKSVQEILVEAQQKVLDQPGVKEAREGQELLDAAKDAQEAANAANDKGDKDAAAVKTQDANEKTREARAKFAQAVAVKPDLYVAWLMQGDIDQKAGKNDDAIMAAEKCLAIKPEFPQCLALAMNAAQAKCDKAIYEKYAERYKTANPTDPTLYYNEAVSYLNKADDAKAKPLLEKALEADPKYADAMFQLGMVYFRMGDTAKAKEMLQNFLATAPSHKEAPTAQEMLKYM